MNFPPDFTPPPRFTPDVLDQPADYGVLALLEGTWVNHDAEAKSTARGLHTTCMPSPGSTSEMIAGKFTFLCEDYTEKLTFTPVKGGVRNRGGTNEQFIGAMEYKQSIQTMAGVNIHEENGMYLWLKKMYIHPADAESIARDIGYPELSPGDGEHGPLFVPKYSVARSGTIPHGSTIQIFGTDSHVKPGRPQFPNGDAAWDFDHLAISRSMGGAGTSPGSPINLDQPPPAWVHDKTLPVTDPAGNKTYTQRILAHELYPYSVRPDLRLRDRLADQDVKSYYFIQMDSQQDGGPQGGILNTPMISRFTPVRRMKLRMWIEQVLENGREVWQLQYEQIQHFEFGFGTDGGTTIWPHIQVNTLRKVCR